MPKQNFSGTYEGTLWYGEGYPAEFHNASLSFRMEITEDDYSFSGTSVDVEGVGISPDEARVAGVIDEEGICFEKQYKRFHYAGENGETIIDNDTEGWPLDYDGIYDQESGMYKGIWQYVGYKRIWLIFSKKVIFGQGTFELRRTLN